MVCAHGPRETEIPTSPPEKPVVLSRSHFTLQRRILSRFPPLSNDLTYRVCSGLFFLQVIAGISTLPGLHPAVTLAVVVPTFLTYVLAVVALLLLLFAADALPDEYGRIVDVRERLHPITTAGLAYFFATHFIAFANMFALLLKLDGRAFGPNRPASYFDCLYFTVVTSCTVGYGDFAPKTLVARAVTIVAILVFSVLLLGVLAVVISSYVNAMAQRRAYFLSRHQPNEGATDPGRQE